MLDHQDYSSHFEDQENNEECLNAEEGLDICDQNFNKYMKYGDELLIDMIRARPYLYDKTTGNYKDTNMKKNAWTEIATTLNMTVTDCMNRWLRLRQRFSKERQLREQETRSGAGKPARQKWVLFESLAFLENHIAQRRSFSNVNFIKTSKPNSVSGTLLKTQHSIVIQDDREMSANDNSNHKTPSSTSGQKSLHTSMSKEICTLSKMSGHESQTILHSELDHQLRSPSPLLCRTPLAAIEETSQMSSTSSSSNQTAASNMKGSNIVSPPLSCFSGNQQRTFKKRKIDSMETAFHQMNNTLSTMATEVCSRKKPVNDNDTDVLIGKLVTAELQTKLQQNHRKRS